MCRSRFEADLSVSVDWCTCFSTKVDLPIGTNCAAILSDFFLYSYEADFMHAVFKKNEKR
jgi:hypothetical protein